MSADTIYNAAPMVINLGTQDDSTTQLPIEPETYPQHCPKFFLYTKKGPTTPQLVSGAHAAQLYSTDSFSNNYPWFNYNTALYNVVSATGNKCMLQRLQPTDAGPAANLTLWLDVLPVTVGITQRNSDGSIAVDSNGDAISTGETTSGYQVKWVVTSSNSTEYTLGEQIITPGNQSASTGTVMPNASDYTTGTDAASGQGASTRYPILEFQTSSFGNWGNNVGISIFAGTQTSQNNTISSTILQQSQVYPYFFQVYSRPNSITSASTVPTILGSNNILASLIPNTINPLTGADMYLGNTFVSSYNNTTNPTFPRVYGDFNNVYIYEDNITTLLNMFYTAETPYINQWSDFNGAPDQYGLFNFISGVSSQNVPYQTFFFAQDPDSVSLNSYTINYAAGSSDGTMNDTNFAALVENEMAAYLDPSNPVQDLAVNVESILYDSGFPLTTKQSLVNFIAVRPDTFVVLSTYVNNTPPPTADEEYSTAVTLSSFLQQFPESPYFGTPVMRGSIVGRCGNLINSNYTKTVPLTFAWAEKAATFMGASDYKWIADEIFEGAPGSVITTMNNVNITWVSPASRNIDWSVGLNWVQAYDRASLFFPAFKTVYNNDTSVDTSFITVMAVCTLNKIQHEAWRMYSGTTQYTNAQLVDRTNSFITQASNGIFAGMFKVEPNTYISDNDEIRGYSWHINTNLYANNAKTVGISYVTTYRMSQYSAS